MYSVEIDYVDYFNGNEETTEVFHFNLTAPELAKITAEFPEGLDVFMDRALKENRLGDTFRVIEMLLVRGYGRRIELDGKIRFVKDAKWWLYLLPSPEFEMLYLKLNNDTDFAIKFWNGLVSPTMLKQAKEINETAGAKKSGEPKFRELTLEEQVAALQAKLADKKPANE